MIVKSIDRDFSLYKLVQDLQPPKLFTVKRHVLAKWCATIETEAIEHQIKPSVFAGFQLFQFFLPVMERFQRMAKITNQMYIFGQPDMELPPLDNINVVHLNVDDQLRQEWFLIICHEDFMRAIIAREITEPGTADEERLFEGIRTNHKKTIEQLDQSLSQLVKRAQAKE